MKNNSQKRKKLFKRRKIIHNEIATKFLFYKTVSVALQSIEVAQKTYFSLSIGRRLVKIVMFSVRCLLVSAPISKAITGRLNGKISVFVEPSAHSQ